MEDNMRKFIITTLLLVFTFSDSFAQLGRGGSPKINGGAINRQLRLYDGAEALPSLAWEDPSSNWDVGFWLSGHNILALSIGGQEKWVFTSTNIGGSEGDQPQMRAENSNFNHPVLIPDRGSNTSGIGGVGGYVSIISGTEEGIRVNAGVIAVNGNLNYGADAQSDDDYEISIPGITALVAGLTVTFRAATINTGACTLEIGEVGDLDDIKKQHDVALADGDIEAGQIVVCVFDGTNWQMISQIAN